MSMTGGGGDLPIVSQYVHYSFARSLYCHGYSKFGSWRGGGGGGGASVAPVTTALHKRGGHIIHKGHSMSNQRKKWTTPLDFP